MRRLPIPLILIAVGMYGVLASRLTYEFERCRDLENNGVRTVGTVTEILPTGSLAHASLTQASPDDFAFSFKTNGRTYTGLTNTAIANITERLRVNSPIDVLYDPQAPGHYVVGPYMAGPRPARCVQTYTWIMVLGVTVGLLLLYLSAIRYRHWLRHAPRRRLI